MEEGQGNKPTCRQTDTKRSFFKAIIMCQKQKENLISFFHFENFADDSQIPFWLESEFCFGIKMLTTRMKINFWISFDSREAKISSFKVLFHPEKKILRQPTFLFITF